MPMLRCGMALCVASAACYARRVRRAVALLLLTASLAPGTWLRDKPVAPDGAKTFRVVPLPSPPPGAARAALRPFTLAGAWRLDIAAPGLAMFKLGGLSALLPRRDGRLVAFDDRDHNLRFAPPGAPPERPAIGNTARARAPALRSPDSEAATLDPATGRVWIAWESSGQISRQDPGGGDPRVVTVPAMARWPANRGAESLARLRDGRFVVLCEAFADSETATAHEGLLFPFDPVAGAAPARFRLIGPARFSPSDMAALPDGRVLILFRRLVWPLPIRFAARIAIADPAAIRPGGDWRATVIAQLEPPLPVDNYEGIAVVPAPRGHLTVWLVSDANGAASQRTLLLKLDLDPKALPRR